jgi:Holliday junction resolvase RusA-like endonuclease
MEHQQIKAQFQFEAILRRIVSEYRASNLIVFVSTAKLSPEFYDLRSKRITLMVVESSGHPVQMAIPAPQIATVKPEQKMIVIPGNPCPKPRMTRQDKFLVGQKARPSVARYRAFEDRAQLAATGLIPKDLEGEIIRFYFAMPASWPMHKRLEMDGKLHTQKPDLDNCIKAVNDSLFVNDEIIARIEAVKFWTNGEPRTEVEFY